MELILLCSRAVPLFTRQKREGRFICKSQRGLTAVRSLCERWNMKINERKTQVIYFSGRLVVPQDVLQLNGQDILFVDNVTYLGVTFNTT
jgi:hypothetical protein